MWCRRSSDHAVNRISCRSIAASVCSSTSGNWIAWLRERLAPRDARVRVRDRFVDAELRRAERRRGLPDAVLVHEVLRELEPALERAEHRRLWDTYVAQRHFGVVG